MRFGIHAGGERKNRRRDRGQRDRPLSMSGQSGDLITRLEGIKLFMFEITDNNNAKFFIYAFKRCVDRLGFFIRNGGARGGIVLRGGAFSKHLVFKGSRNYSCRRIKQEIEGRGGSLNGFTSQEITGYYAHFLNKNALKVADILSDMVIAPIIKAADVEKERKVILEEIKMYNDLPSPRASMLLDRLLWPGHPLGEEIAGTFESVGGISRSDLMRFKEKFYAPQEILISASGDIPVQEIIDLLKKKIPK